MKKTSKNESKKDEALWILMGVKDKGVKLKPWNWLQRKKVTEGKLGNNCLLPLIKNSIRDWLHKTYLKCVKKEEKGFKGEETRGEDKGGDGEEKRGEVGVWRAIKRRMLQRYLGFSFSISLQLSSAKQTFSF